VKRSILLVLAACSWMAVIGSAASENLLETSSFEEGIYRWFQSETGDPYVEFEWTSETACDGEYALRVSCSQTEPREGKIFNSWYYEFFPHSVRGETLTLRFFVRTEGIASGHGAYARIEAEQTTLISRMLAWQESRGISGTSEWTECCLRFEMPKDSELARIHLGLNGTGIAWFDDVVLTVGGNCSDEIGPSASFTPIKFDSLPSVPVVYGNGISTPVEPKDTKPWTIAIYNAADYPGLNPVDYFAFELRSSQVMNVVMLEDQYQGPSKIWSVEEEQTFSHLTCLADLKEVDTTSQATLQDFLNFCKAWFPAEHTLLLIYDHGGGWRGTAKDWTSSPNADTWLTPAKLRNGLEAIGGVDALLYTAPCNMASIEATFEISECTELVVASEEVSGFVPWLTVLSQIGDLLAEYPDVSPAELGWYVLSYLEEKQQQARENSSLAAYATYQFTSLGTDDMQELVEAVDGLACALIDQLPLMQEALVELRNAALSFRNGELVDLGDFAEQCRAIPALVEPADNVLTALNRTVWGIRGNEEYEDARGLNIYFPSFQSYLETWEEYEKSNARFLVASRWEEFLRALYADPLY